MNERDRASRLGRLLGRAAKNARPRAERAIEDAAPRLKNAAARAADFVGEHDQEIKQTAARLVRARLPGPAGMIVDALTSQQSASVTKCPQCGATSAESAKFCSECGASLSSQG